MAYIHIQVPQVGRQAMIAILMIKRLFAELNVDEKGIIRSSQDLNLGLLNSGQLLLSTELLELWNLSRGYRWHLSIDTVRLTGWIFNSV